MKKLNETSLVKIQGETYTKIRVYCDKGRTYKERLVKGSLLNLESGHKLARIKAEIKKELF